ncbi:MAG: DEAD/DEAH box helicase [Desulfobacterales bacterium]
MTFDEFKLHPRIAAGVRAAGFTTPTPIQAKAIPSVLAGSDLMGLAQTGTGKTAVFALPILHRLLEGRRGCIRALVIAPTRELAEQIHQAFRTLGRETGLKSTAVYGGVGFTPQFNRLRSGTDIVVACPGRLLDHIGRGTVDLSLVSTLVLDEADQMFDMGFLPDIRKIMAHLPAQRQTLLFSATMPAQIRTLAKDILKNPRVVQAGETAAADTVSHALYPVAPHLKTALLLHLLNHTETGSVLVFTRTKHRAKRLGEQLARIGFRSASLQGNLSQNRRQAAMEGFRTGAIQILVATDIAARGIDVTRVSHVINYDVPSTPEAYIHRIGRTGRASRSGDAFTLVTSEDADQVRAIDRIIGSRIERRTITDFDYSAPSPKSDIGQDRRPDRPVDKSRFSRGRSNGERSVGSVPANGKRPWGRGGRPGRPAGASSRFGNRRSHTTGNGSARP